MDIVNIAFYRHANHADRIDVGKTCRTKG